MPSSSWSGARPRRSESPDESRRAATDARYIERVEGDNEFLRGQIAVKDTQIAALLERDHETNSLINGLQRMLAPLLAAPDRKEEKGPPVRHDHIDEQQSA
jgi:hypothetical protein